MAEAIVNSQLGDHWQASSAGTQPSRHIHPKALATLAEVGIQHQDESKLANQLRKVDFDLMVTVCDDIQKKIITLLKSYSH